MEQEFLSYLSELSESNPYFYFKVFPSLFQRVEPKEKTEETRISSTFIENNKNYVVSTIGHTCRGRPLGGLDGR